MNKPVIHRCLVSIMAVFLLCVHAAEAQFWVQTDGPTGAQIASMAVAPDGAIYAGTYYGTLYRSTDRGASWISKSAGLPRTGQNVAALRNGTLFVVTYDSGVYRSNDRGESWLRIAADLDSATGTYSSALAAAPDGLLYMIKEGKLYRSSDDGTTWTKGGEYKGRRLYGVISDSRGNLYALGLVYVPAYDIALLHSTDHGETWSMLERPGDSNRIIRLSVDSSDSFIAIVSDSLLYRSNDYCRSWTPISNPVPGRGLDAVYSVGSTMFASANGIWLYRSTDRGATWHVPDSSLFDIIARGAVMDREGGMYFGDWQEGVYRSDDSGRSWYRAQKGMVSRNVITMLAHRDGAVYASTEYTGLYRSDDGGRTWEWGVPKVNRWAGSKVRSIVEGPDGELLAGGYIAIYRSTDRGVSWSKFANSGIVNKLASLRNGHIMVATMTGSMFSSDYGATWNYSSSSKEVFTVAVDSSGLFYTSNEDGTFRRGSSVSGLRSSKAIAVHPDGRVYFGTGGGIYISRDSGRSVGSRMLASKNIGAITFARNGQAYALALNDGVYRQTGDTTWEAVNTGLPRKYVTDIVAGSDGHIYVSTWSGGIFRSAEAISASVPAASSPSARLTVSATPNPFGTRSAIRFRLDAPSEVSIIVSDQLGREVLRLVDGDLLEAGDHEAVVEGNDLPAGIYHISVTAGGCRGTAALIRI